LGIGLVMATPVPETGNVLWFIPSLLSAVFAARKLHELA